MFTYIRDAGRPVTREDAASAVGISRKLAAFHLDKLVDVGLLRAAYDEPERPGRVGRTPKTYRPTDLDVRVSIPARRHEDLSDILVDALVAEPAGGSAMQSAMQVARSHGETLGAEERHRSRAGRLGAERALTLAERVLRERGFDPTRDEPLCVRLRNCPFHPLAAQAPQVVCGINHAFLSRLSRRVARPDRAGHPQPSARSVLRGATGRSGVDRRDRTGRRVTTWSASSACTRSARARATRDRMVPTGQPHACAACS